MSLDRFAQRVWYGRQLWFVSVLLLPLSWVFGVIVRSRRWAYRCGIPRSIRVGRPVIVVGNLTVGGTGKTPLIVWLAHECSRRGLRAAIVCRGYGGTGTRVPQIVTAHSDARVVGDEAVLLARSFAGPVIACSDRVAAARLAVAEGTDLILCDDGLQHYRLARDAEIVLMDASRAFGNERLLPAGPLREPAQRAAEATMLVRTLRGSTSRSIPSRALQSLPTVDARFAFDAAVSLTSIDHTQLSDFRGQRVHAIAGIGNPEAFFDMLRAQGLKLDARALPDHAAISAADVEFGDTAPVLMTEKDAVKCRAFADERLWYVPLRLEISGEHQAMLWGVVQRVLDARSPHR